MIEQYRLNVLKKSTDKQCTNIIFVFPTKSFHQSPHFITKMYRIGRLILINYTHTLFSYIIKNLTESVHIKVARNIYYIIAHEAQIKLHKHIIRKLSACMSMHKTSGSLNLFFPPPCAHSANKSSINQYQRIYIAGRLRARVVRAGSRNPRGYKDYVHAQLAHIAPRR